MFVKENPDRKNCWRVRKGTATECEDPLSWENVKVATGTEGKCSKGIDIRGGKFKLQIKFQPATDIDYKLKTKIEMKQKIGSVLW